MPKAKKLAPKLTERVTSLESRVSAIEATLNGRLQRLEDKVDNIGAGIRGLGMCNAAIVRELEAAREQRGQELNQELIVLSEKADEWKAR